MNSKTETEIEQAQENFNDKAFLNGVFNDFFGYAKSFWKFSVDGNKILSKEVNGIDVPFPVVDERGKNAYPDIFIFLLPKGWRDDISVLCWKTLWERRGYTVIAPSLEAQLFLSRSGANKWNTRAMRDFIHRHRVGGEKFCIFDTGRGRLDKYVESVCGCAVKLWFGMTKLQYTHTDADEQEEQG